MKLRSRIKGTDGGDSASKEFNITILTGNILNQMDDFLREMECLCWQPQNRADFDPACFARVDLIGN